MLDRICIDLRDEWIEKVEACSFCSSVMLRIFAATQVRRYGTSTSSSSSTRQKFCKCSHRIQSRNGQVVETIREMRHQATSVVIASQDPLSVPRAVIELTSVLLMHRGGVASVNSSIMKNFSRRPRRHRGGPPEVHWAPAEITSFGPSEAADKRFTTRPQKVTDLVTVHSARRWHLRRRSSGATVR